MALVTGGGSGIGRATAQRLAAEGACLVVADRDEPAARTVAEEIGPPDVAVDVAAFGGVDLVVNNAGLSLSRPLLEATVADCGCRSRCGPGPVPTWPACWALPRRCPRCTG